MNDKLKKRFVLILKILISGLLIFIVLKKIDIPQIFNLFKTINLFWIGMATLAFAFSKVISSYRLNLFLKVIEIQVSNKYNLKLYWLGMYYNLFLPGGIGGDGYKIYLLQKKFKKGVKNIFTSILLDRVTGIFALFGLVIALSYILPFQGFFKYFLWIVIPMAFVIYFVVLKYFFNDYIRVFQDTTFLSFIVQILQLVATYFILLSLHNSNNTASYLFIFLISSVVAVIPFTIGGVGARELTFLTGASWLNLDTNVSISVSLLFFLITAVVSLWGMTYSLNEKQLFDYA